MKANSTVVACATSHVEVDWHSINWNKANQNVRLLTTTSPYREGNTRE